MNHGVSSVTNTVFSEENY